MIKKMNENRILIRTRRVAAVITSLLLILSTLAPDIALAAENESEVEAPPEITLEAENESQDDSSEEEAQDEESSDSEKEDQESSDSENENETVAEEQEQAEEASNEAAENQSESNQQEDQQGDEPASTKSYGKMTVGTAQSNANGSETEQEEEKDTSATDDWLGELCFYNGSKSDMADKFELAPSFDPSEHEYTLYIPDRDAGIYAYGISSIGSPKSYTTSDGTYIRYTDTRGNQQDVNASMYYEDKNGNYLTRVVSRSGEGNDLTIYTPEGTKDYTVHVRRITSLMSLKVKFGDEETELFSKGRTSYTLNVPKNCAGETLTITPKAYLYTFDDDSKGNPDYQIRITAGGKQETAATGEPYDISLSGIEETITIRVSYGENRETIYRVRVFPTDNGGAIRFITDTEEAEDFTVRLYNENGVQVRADAEDPRLFRGLFIGNTYKYRASYPGYKSISGNIEAGETELVHTVTFTDRSTGRYLDELKVYPNSSGSATSNYEITRDESLDETFHGTVYTVNYSSRMKSDSFYLAASLSDSAPEGSRIGVTAYDTDGNLQSMNLPDSEGGNPIRRKLAGTIFSTGSGRAIYRIKAGVEDDVEEYVVLVKRTLELQDLSLMLSDDGDSIIEEPFKRSKYAYNASVMKSEELLFIQPAMFEGDDFQVTVDGDQCDGGYMMVILTEEPTQRITVHLSKDDVYTDPEFQGMTYTSEGEYTVDVERLEPAKVTFHTEPDNVIVSVYDRNGERVYSDKDDNHSYSGLYVGRKYNYVASLYGCVSKVGEFTAEDGQVIEVELDSSSAEPQKDVGNVEWWNYRNSFENNGITESSTPDDPEKTTEKWAIMIGGDYNSSCTPPIIAGGYVYTAVGKYIYRVDKDTGEILAVSEELAGDVVYALNPMTYAEGMLFVQIGKGRIQAVGCDSLKSVWISEKLGGQTLSPISYKDGYIYTGTWSSETKAGEYFCISVTDEDDTRGDETKYCTWRYSHTGGFYWAGAYATDKYVVFGSDDGEKEGDYDNSACLYSVSARTGDIIQAISDIQGDIRTSIVYNNGYIYFATKGGVLYRIGMNSDGTFGQIVSLDLGGMATASPLIYNGRVYIGVSGEGGQFNADGGHTFRVIGSDNSGLHNIYSVQVPGYPQAAALLSNAYERYDYSVSGTPDGRIYIYFTYNAKPGGIAMLTDEPGQTAGDVKIIYEPDGEKQEYCISPISADSDGTLYYKNDSGYLIAVTSNNAYVRDITLTPSSGEADWEEDFDPAKLKYSIMVENDAENVSVDIDVPTGRKVTVNGAEYQKGMKVELGEDDRTTIEVKVTYQGKTRTYKLNVERLGTDASLAAITVGYSNNILSTSSHLALDPVFSSDIYEYSTVEYDGDNKFLNLWPEASGKFAEIEVQAVSGVKKINVFRNAAGSNGKTRYAVYFGDGESDAVVDIIVTAGDRKTKATYRVNLVRTDNYPPNITEITPYRMSEEEGTIKFTSNESGKYYYAVTGIEDGQPEIPRTDPQELVNGQNTISLRELSGAGKKVWIIAEDETGNVSRSPVTAIIRPYNVFTQTITVKPSDTKVTVTDSEGRELIPTSVTGADTSIGGSGGKAGSGTETADKTAVYKYDFVEGNTYNVLLKRYGYSDRSDVLLADSGSTSATYELIGIRSSDNYLKGLYVSSSGKWSTGILKLTPSFDKDTARYSASYDGERSHLNVWPVVSDSRAVVKCFAVSGIKASTVNKDETITASTSESGHSFYQIYFADDMFSAEVRIHVEAEDESVRDYFVTLGIKDATPPSVGRVSASRISDSKASVVFKSNEDGEYYYKVVKKGAAEPPINTSSAGTPCYEGTTTITLSGLASGAHDVYVTVKDSQGNVGNMVKFTVPEWNSSGGDSGKNSGDDSGKSDGDKGKDDSGKSGDQSKDGSGKQEAGDSDSKSDSDLKPADGDDSQNKDSDKSGKKSRQSKAKKGAATDGKAAADITKKGGASTSGKSAGLALAKKKAKKPNDKLKKAKKTKKEGALKSSKKKSIDDLNGKSSGSVAERRRKGSSAGIFSNGEVIGDLMDGMTSLANDTYLRFIQLTWWIKILLVLAGLGIVYIAFYISSALNRRYTKALLMNS